MMIISAERCCWRHYFLKETERPSIFMFTKDPILSPQFFDVTRNHWSVRSWEEIHIPQKKYFCSIKRVRNIGVELSAYETGHMERPMVKTTTKTLPRYLVPRLSPFTAYLINKGLQNIYFSLKKKLICGSWRQIAWATRDADTLTALPSQVWGTAARF